MDKDKDETVTIELEPADSSVVVEPPKRKSPGRPWVKGQSGNPAGRKPGTRVKLAQAYFDDLYVEWQRRGPDALREMAMHDPTAFVKLYGSVLPRELILKSLSMNISADLTDRSRDFATQWLIARKHIGVMVEDALADDAEYLAEVEADVAWRTDE
jgi:hypothetical protein